MSLKLLATADLHIGRRPTRLPEEEAGRFSAARMWERIVERAIEEKVAAVLLAGDVVDHHNRFFEAVGPLERGLRRLEAAGIPTVAVAGNHDWDVLPRIQHSVGAALRLLGRDGLWEETVLKRDGSPVVRLQGWSFPQEHVRTSPLMAYSAPVDDGLPTIGMLHCDLDQPASSYVPVARAELKRQPVSFWLLGHIHGFLLDETLPGAPLLYPGSPQARSRTLFSIGFAAGHLQGQERMKIPMSHAVFYRSVKVDGLSIFYREAGPKDGPTILLLHGLPSSSRMFEPLFSRLSDRYHLVAPDYPGFGHSDWPDPKQFAYTFDNLAKVINGFTEAIALSRYTLYMQDYGVPAGFRMALAHPNRIEALIVQDGVAHNEGLGANWAARRAFWADRPAHEADLRKNLLSLATTRTRHVGDDPNVELYDPDLWTDEFAFLSQPGQAEIQSDLFYDYRTNVAAYPEWQGWLRKSRQDYWSSGASTTSHSIPASRNDTARMSPALRCMYSTPDISRSIPKQMRLPH